MVAILVYLQYITMTASYCMFRCIAEFRSLAATEGSLVPSLVPLLESKNVGVLLQALRAIGNLCHEEGNSKFMRNH